MAEPLTCPFCQCSDIRRMFDGEDGLRSYTCHACTRTFHVTELQPLGPEEETTEPLTKSRSGPKR